MRQSIAIQPFGLRMPPELRAMLEKSAQDNTRSLTAEIISRLQDSYASDEPICADTKAFPLRMPPDLHDWIMAEAKRNGRSATKEIVILLERERQERERREEAA